MSSWRTLLIDERPDRRPAGAEEGGDAAGPARGRRPPGGRARPGQAYGRGHRRRRRRLPPDLLELLPEQGGGAPLERPGPDRPPPRARRPAARGRAALAGDVRR